MSELFALGRKRGIRSLRRRGNVSLADKGVLYECVQKIHPPPVDRTVENGYNKDARGAAGRRLTPALVREVTARLGSGGYFFFAT